MLLNPLAISYFLIIYLLTPLSVQSSIETKALHEFPSTFKFGVGTSAYQIEGAWNEDGKGPSIWDVGLHTQPDRVADRTNGDIATDSYHKFDQDLEMLKTLGVNFYRFSISWPRIMPNGDISSLNIPGIRYYNSVIDKLIANGIEPMVTMYHWDLPHELQKIGGLMNPLFPQYFEKYADVLYKNFGDRVKLWNTFNEPSVYCLHGYEWGIWPPFIDAGGVGGYLCIDHTLKANALAYHLYQRKYLAQQKGKVGIVANSGYAYSKQNYTDVVDRKINFYLGWITHPIFSKMGGYPKVVESRVAFNSLREGRAWSRLPVMDEEWRNLIKGSADFLGLNYYTSEYVESARLLDEQSYYNDAGVDGYPDPTWKRAKSDWLYSVPQGLQDLLGWIRDKYQNVEVFITENGWSDEGELTDDDRVIYLEDHLRAVWRAIQDGCNIAGYTHWSLLDNFEWLGGYTERFGLFNVDFKDPNRTRTIKKSGTAYQTIIKNRGVEEE